MDRSGAVILFLRSCDACKLQMWLGSSEMRSANPQSRARKGVEGLGILFLIWLSSCYSGFQDFGVGAISLFEIRFGRRRTEREEASADDYFRVQIATT